MSSRKMQKITKSILLSETMAGPSGLAFIVRPITRMGSHARAPRGPGWTQASPPQINAQ